MICFKVSFPSAFIVFCSVALQYCSTTSSGSHVCVFSFRVKAFIRLRNLCRNFALYCCFLLVNHVSSISLSATVTKDGPQEKENSSTCQHVGNGTDILTTPGVEGEKLTKLFTLQPLKKLSLNLTLSFNLSIHPLSITASRMQESADTGWGVWYALHQFITGLFSNSVNLKYYGSLNKQISTTTSFFTALLIGDYDELRHYDERNSLKSKY